MDDVVTLAPMFAPDEALVGRIVGQLAPGMGRSEGVRGERAPSRASSDGP